MTNQSLKTPLTEEQINEITDMARLFFSPEDIAVNIGLPVEDFKLHLISQEGPVFVAFKKGWLLGEIPLRKAIARAAENGSNPAQVKMLELKTDAESRFHL